ncbi:MAG: DNA internalization-related competence protein ComEC/Rec2 [Rhodocyclaceae bacterium]|nr:DNA internalization-related competence protein ComEC/Rec2 [Rhodocyclaceae bacterium]
MQALLVAFVGGVYVLQQFAELPSRHDTVVAAGWALTVLITSLSFRKSALARRRFISLLTACALALGAVGLGAAYAAWRAHERLDDALASALEGRDIQMTGVVAGLPEQGERGVRFDFVVESASEPVPDLIRLSVYERERIDAPVVTVRAGERWQWTVRLRRPHGNLNPHGFDYEAYLLERGIRATGYVRPGPATLVDASASGWGYSATRWREQIRQRLNAALTDSEEQAPYAGVMVALAVGDQTAIPRDQWLSFSRTGITHLVSISGLHITMLAGLAYGFAAVVWRALVRRGGWASTQLLHWPLPLVGSAVGLCAAAGYCVLAGFAIPAQRTLYMLAVVALAQLSRRNIGFVPGLTLALWVVVVIDPWAVLAAGFWLSFGQSRSLLSVAVVQTSHRAQERSVLQRLATTVRAWALAQWAIAMGMVPILLGLFGQVSLISPLANALAIPVVSLVVTPLVLVAAASDLGLPLILAHWVFAGVMQVLDAMAACPFAVWQQAAAPASLIALALAGVIVSFLPLRWYWRAFGLLGMLPLLIWQAPRPAFGDAWVRVLDVGQGLAVHVQTMNHDLIFDTGPGYSRESDAGSRLIAPYLRAVGVKELDELIISHADNDHAGGAMSLVRSMPVRQITHSLPDSLPLLAALAEKTAPRRCHRGIVFEWDGVSLQLLHPATEDPAESVAKRRNAQSCVLQLRSRGGRLLIPSDIEAKQEAELLNDERSQPGLLRADVLVAPHHGSRTSSTPDFVSAVGAKTVIFPVGYRNSYGHPRTEVLERYLTEGTQVLRTDTDGAVTVQLNSTGIAIEHAREVQRRYWHQR